MSEFSDALRQMEPGSIEKLERNERAEQLQIHLTSISGDSSGSQPAEYLTAGHAKAIEEFLVEAANRNWINSRPIEFAQSKFGSPVWSHPKKAPGRTLHDTRLNHTKSFRMNEVDLGPAYTIGNVNIPGLLTPVVICADGLLRCYREPTMFRKSYGMGYGRLPDRDRAGIILPSNPGGLPVYLARLLLPKK